MLWLRRAIQERVYDFITPRIWNMQLRRDTRRHQRLRMELSSVLLRPGGRGERRTTLSMPELRFCLEVL